MVNTKGYGFFEAVKLGVLTAQATSTVNLSSSIKEHLGFVNVLDVTNTSTEDVEFYLDNNNSNPFVVLAGTSKSMNGTRFSSLQVKNNHATNDTANEEVIVAVQKDVFLRDELELKRDK